MIEIDDSLEKYDTMKQTITLLCFLFCCTSMYSQRLKTPTLSPYTKISQEVGLTEVILEYSRPSAKGRTVFGDLVPFDKMWRTGANASTKITITESAKIANNPLTAGTYAIYTIPGEDKWTVIIHANTKMRSIAGDAYKPENDVFRFEVKPRRVSDFVETFTFQFAELRSNAVNLELLWENTSVSIPIAFDVDKQIANQMKEFMKDPDAIPHRTYFEAAQYYINNNKSQAEALGFINSALKSSPENFRYGLLKSKIQARSGDIAAAMKTVNLAHGWAKKAKNSNYIEQTDIFRKSLIK